MEIIDILEMFWKRIGPSVKIDDEVKIVYLRENLFFSNIFEVYYSLKGYDVKRLQD